MLDIILQSCKSIAHPNIIYILADNTFYLGMLFGACGTLGELENNEKIHPCLKTNLKIASNFLLISSILNLYRVNRF